MIEVVLFWASAFGPLAFLICLWAISPLLVPALLLIRLRVDPRSVSKTACIVASIAAMPYALAEKWLGGTGIVLVIPLVAICPWASWWAFRQKAIAASERSSVADRRWAWAMLVPYALIVAVRLLGSKGSAVG